MGGSHILFTRIQAAWEGSVLALRTHPFRVSLAACGIVIGSGGLAAVLLLSSGLTALAVVELTSLGMAEVSVTALRHEDLDYVRLPRESEITFDPRDLSELTSEPSVGAVHAWLRDSTALRLWLNGQPHGVSMIGLHSPQPVPAYDPVLSGRLPDLTSLDRGTTKEVLVSYGLARQLAGAGNTPASVVGSDVRVGGYTLRIVGVADSTHKAKFLVMWMRREDLRVFDARPHQTIVLRPTSNIGPDRMDQAVAGIETWIAAQRPGWRNGVAVAAAGGGAFHAAQQRSQLVRLVLGAFCLVTIVVAGMGITNVILASVLERTREVGLRKAVGARFGDVVGQFLAESLTIAGVGGLLGTLGGSGVAAGIAWFVRWDTSQPLYIRLGDWSVAIPLAVSLATGLLAGVWPAVRAARLAPIEAMRVE